MDLRWIGLHQNTMNQNKARTKRIIIMMCLYSYLSYLRNGQDILRNLVDHCEK